MLDERKSLSIRPVQQNSSFDDKDTPGSLTEVPSLSTSETTRGKLPLGWKLTIIILTCLCTFGNHWSNGLIVAQKTTIIKTLDINNSEFATLVAVTNLVNTFLCVALGFGIDKWGGPLLSVYLTIFHLAGSAIEAGSVTGSLRSYPVLILGKVVAAVGDGSLDNAQHRIFSTYFAPGKGFASSIGIIWSIANLAQYTGQTTANVITQNLGSFSWSLWISAVISLFSSICAIGVFFLDRYLRRTYNITDQTSGKRHVGASKTGGFKLDAIRHMPATFWFIVLFAIFENAGVQSFVSISTQFAQQRLKKGAVVGGWVASMYLLLPIGLTPFIGIFVDLFGHRVTLLFMSGLTFLISMLLLKLSHTVPTFVAAYVMYALSQSITPAPQVEIIRSVLPDPQYFATAFAIKKSVVQASIVIITTAAGKLQDLSPTNSLDPAVTLWLSYAAASVAVSGGLLLVSYTTLLPAARLSQVKPALIDLEISRLWSLRRSTRPVDDAEDADPKFRESILKSPLSARMGGRWFYAGLSVGVILLGWIMFGLGVNWGVHGSVIAGTTGE
ncbi:MFS general substrate transporter [Mycena rosella]|uniref:Lysosomal dipeptide transporter MFSD1 n=1 Tax=Mycena rosella TaxID=1033263 RepID=A0AAD7CMM8_MYCRO|nr:MFS general substrate transporter [Mycena rosella]